MTTIAWDSKSLASDTRISTGKARLDDSSKIHVITKEVLIDGHKVLAVGTSGNANHSRMVLESLQSCGKTAERIVDKLKEAWDLVGSMETFTFQLLIVCDTACYTLYCERYMRNRKCRSKVRLTQFEKSKPIATGSGSKAALLMMRHFDMPARLAVAAASTVDDATGSFVQYLSIGTKCGRRYEHHYKNVEATIKKLRTNICAIG